MSKIKLNKVEVKVSKVETVKVDNRKNNPGRPVNKKSARYNEGTYIVLVNKHALTIKDGIVIDNPDMKFTGYRRVVETFFKVYAI